MAMDTMPSALDMAFRTALILTGAMKTAEAAVMRGIGACEDLSPRGLMRRSGPLLRGLHQRGSGDVAGLRG